MYTLLRSFLFLFDAEKVHYFSMNALKLFCKIPLVKPLISKMFTPQHTSGEFKLLNIEFKNRVGLGAGFDKNAKYLNELEALGFGFIEIGTVTPIPQAGNDKLRLFRLPKDKALINRMGFNNDGVQVVAERLKLWNIKAAKTGRPKLIIGGNIGKNKVTPNENAWKDYEICFTALQNHVDYFVVNVSSPNTPGLRELQEKDSLSKILQNLQRINKLSEKPLPIFLKIAPDLSIEQVDDVIELALEIKLDGLVAANTTIDRSMLKTAEKDLTSIGAGGLSGLPLHKKSTDLISYLYKNTNGKIPIIASGGIFTGNDAKEKINAGASLLQVWTGFVYEGPAIVKNICKEL